MNYGVIVFGVVIVLAMVNYLLRARKHYTGPVVHVKRE